MDNPVMTGKYPYGAWLIRAALFDLVDEEKGSGRQTTENEFRFTLPVFGNSGTFFVRLVDRPAKHPGEKDSCELTLQMCDPDAPLGKEGMRRAMHYILDNVVQRIENELRSHADS